MAKKRLLVIALLVCVVFLLAGCIPGDGTYEDKPAGFFSGVWHGWIAPVSLIVGIFNHNIRIYETVNTGWGYDFGYYIAVISGFGGIALTRRARHRTRRDGSES